MENQQSSQNQPKGSKTGTITASLIGIAVLVLIVNATVKKDESGDKVNQNVEITNTNQPEVITSNVDTSGWKTYRNEKLGIEISYPRQNKDGQRIVSVETLEDGNVVYILPNGTYSKKISANIQNAKTDIEKSIGIPWAIVVKNVNSDSELASFIRERYHSECNIARMDQSAQAGVYDVSIEPSSGELSEGCFINWTTFIKYSPQLHKVAAWDIGQDANFYHTSNETVEDLGFAIDSQVANSFRFLEN